MHAQRGNLDHLRDVLATYMARKGLRSTEQRRLIIETFSTRPRTSRSKSCSGKCAAPTRGVGYATVYRHLEAARGERRRERAPFRRRSYPLRAGRR